MQGVIPISTDERRHSIWDWIGVLTVFTFLTLHMLGFTTGMVLVIWRDILAGDYTETDLFRALGITGIGFPLLVTFYVMGYVERCFEPVMRQSLLLDIQARRLILERRHITGFTRRKSFAIADIQDINVAWTKDEDGKETPQLVLILAGKPVVLVITNPSHAADLPALAARLREQMAAAGWSDGSLSSDLL
jgi:hypothetical protein